MLDALVRSLHLLAVLLIAGCLIITTLAARPQVTRDDISNLVKVDTFLLLALGAAAAFGLTLWLWTGKPSAFFTGNPLFHLKLSLFVLLLVLLVYPGLFLRRQQARLRSSSPVGARPVHSADAVTAPEEALIEIPVSVRWSLRLAVAVMLFLPVLAYLMARGVGYPSA